MCRLVIMGMAGADKHVLCTAYMPERYSDASCGSTSCWSKADHGLPGPVACMSGFSLFSYLNSRTIDTTTNFMLEQLAI
jgi:hypothetical protein